MSSKLSFLEHDPIKGASLLFQNTNTLSNTELWDIFDFLLWRCKQSNKHSLSTLIDWYRNLISYGQDFTKTFCSSSHKFVCGATITSGDPIYRCRTCQSDNNTLICVDCWKHSTHTGHDWFATYTSGSGCCDCGDPLSWDPKGFCTKHPGPSAGDNIVIDTNIEYVTRLLCAYIIYIISHSFNDSNECSDVIYLSNHTQCKASMFWKSFQECHPCDSESVSVHRSNNNNSGNGGRSIAMQQLMNSPLWGFFNRNMDNNGDNGQLQQIINAIRNESQMEIDNDESESTEMSDENALKQFETMHLKDTNVINKDFAAWKRLKMESNNEKYLSVSVKEHCLDIIERKWNVCKGIITHVLPECSKDEWKEIAMKLRMYNSAVIAVGDSEYITALQKKWIEKDEEKQYNAVICDISTDYCRVISKPLLLRLISEISEWCNNSEILKRCIAQAMMLKITKLSPDYPLLKPKGNLKIDIPPWQATEDSDIKMDNYGTNDEIVRENECAYYYLMLHDHVLRPQYMPSLSDLWYALITLPPVKHRVSQIFATVYQLLCNTYGIVRRESRYQFIGLSVQFMTINPITEICASHGLFKSVISGYMKLICPLFDTHMKGLGQNVNDLELFRNSEDQYKAKWDLVCRSSPSHIMFDQRYLVSVDVMMDYLLFNANGGGFEQFWTRYIHQMCMVQNSLSMHRRYRQHIEYEDRDVINYLKFELNMFFANQRVIFNGLYKCIMECKGKDNKEKYEKGLEILIDIIYYGLTLVHKSHYFEIVFENENAKFENHRNCIKMKLSNFDGAYLEEFVYFRTDRDRVSVVLPLSRFIMNLAGLYTEITSESFEQIIGKVFTKYGNTDPDLNSHICEWVDYSLRFITIFDQFHADLWLKNGDTFRTLVFNFERSDFWHIFYGAHFSVLHSFATQIIPPSNLLTLILHRYCIHDWFANNKVSLLNYSHNEDLSQYTNTGWKHWSDSNRTLKMITYALHTLIAMISEPNYCLMLSEDMQNKYDHTIRYDLIQWLVLSPQSMSELTNKIFVHNENETEKEEKLRIILNEIAVYHEPGSMEDTGKFALKSEFYTEFNPYFKKYDRYNPGFMQSSSNEQSDATERYLKFIASEGKMSIDDIMFPNWSTQLIAYSNTYQLQLLCTPYMGLVWNCILYHFYINDTTRYTVSLVQSCLRLISMAVQALIDSKFDLQSENGTKLIQNFTQCFNFRLTNKFDHITDDNKDQIMKQSKNESKESEDTNDTYLNSAKIAKYNLIDIHQTNDNNTEGVGSVLWFLCKIFLTNTALSDLPPLNMNDGTDVQMRDKTPKLLEHIPSAQRLLIEEIVTKLYSLRIKALMNVMTPIWPQPQAMERSFSALSEKSDNANYKKPELTQAEKRRKKKARRAQKKMLKKMRKQKEKFAMKHSKSLINDEREERLEQKQMSEAFGVGMDHHCIVCKSKERQDTMFMMGFAQNCSLLQRCMDNTHELNQNNNIANESGYLQTRKGLNFIFCGHFVHKHCYDTFIINKVRTHYRHEHYYGRGTLSIHRFEYACPYCKTVANIVVPLTKVYRNCNLYWDKFENIKFDHSNKGVCVSDINAEIALNYETVSDSLVCRTASTTFFTKLLWISNGYKHESHSDLQYLKDFGARNICFVYVNGVSYTIAMFEVKFRAYSLQQKKDKLCRNISLINTFVSVMWTRAQYSSFQYLKLPLLVAHSWKYIQNKVLSHQSVSEEKEGTVESDERFEDPFLRLVCGILSHPSTFVFSEDITQSKYEKKGQTTLDFYQLILACYIMQMTHLLLVFVVGKSEKGLRNYEKYALSDWQSLFQKILIDSELSKERNEELMRDLYRGMVTFLRKALIIYNSFLNQKMDSLVKVLWLSNEESECDLICDMLHLPVIHSIISECWNDEYFQNYLSVVNVKYILKLCAIPISKNKALSLIELPNDYNVLFGIAAGYKCVKKGILAIKSGLCLLCGQILCIDCCHDSVIQHCRDCNDGVGVVLYLQRSSVILIWNTCATQYKSIFLDKYGETDEGLYRGVQLKLNVQRYNQLTQLLLHHLIPNKMTQIRKTHRDFLENRLQL